MQAMSIELPKREPGPFCENLAGRVTADSNRTKKWAFVELLDLAAAFVNPYQHRLWAVLVVPTRHASTVLDLTEPESESLARLVRRVAHAIHAAFGLARLNISQINGVASGQQIPHYHAHVLPGTPASGRTNCSQWARP
jgi:diadenosine tetraphosphate (Ap4A) HIT family hydrolase